MQVSQRNLLQGLRTPPHAHHHQQNGRKDTTGTAANRKGNAGKAEKGDSCEPEEEDGRYE